VRTPARGTSVQLRHSANDRITIPLLQDQEWNLRRGIEIGERQASTSP